MYTAVTLELYIEESIKCTTHLHALQGFVHVDVHHVNLFLMIMKSKLTLRCTTHLHAVQGLVHVDVHVAGGLS